MTCIYQPSEATVSSDQVKTLLSTLWMLDFSLHYCYCMQRLIVAYLQFYQNQIIFCSEIWMAPIALLPHHANSLGWWQCSWCWAGCGLQGRDHPSSHTNPNPVSDYVLSFLGILLHRVGKRWSLVDCWLQTLVLYSCTTSVLLWLPKIFIGVRGKPGNEAMDGTCEYVIIGNVSNPREGILSMPQSFHSLLLVRNCSIAT